MVSRPWSTAIKNKILENDVKDWKYDEKSYPVFLLLSNTYKIRNILE